MKRKGIDKIKRLTYEEWEQERQRRLEELEKVEEEKRKAAMKRWAAKFRKMKPVQALPKDDKTLIHEHWDEKYG